MLKRFLIEKKKCQQYCKKTIFSKTFESVLKHFTVFSQKIYKSKIFIEFHSCYDNNLISDVSYNSSSLTVSHKKDGYIN